LKTPTVAAELGADPIVRAFTPCRRATAGIVRSITGVAAENAELLLFALGPAGFFRLWPRGAGRADIEHHFSASWSIISTASEDKIPEKLSLGTTATWYRLKRKLG
jgi:hypothetical protein